jgi:hypothetical protein
MFEKEVFDLIDDIEIFHWIILLLNIISFLAYQIALMMLIMEVVITILHRWFHDLLHKDQNIFFALKVESTIKHKENELQILKAHISNTKRAH